MLLSAFGFISFAILLLFKLSIFSNFDCFVDDIEVVFVPSPGSLRFHGTWLFYPAACMFLYVYIYSAFRGISANIYSKQDAMQMAIRNSVNRDHRIQIVNIIRCTISSILDTP